MNIQYKLKDLPFPKQYFWSYDFNSAALPLSRIMEQLINYGNFEDHLNLFLTFPYNELKDTYLTEIRPMISGKRILRDGMQATKLDLRNVKYMDYLFEVFKEYVVA
ncbi:MAG: hypothetical protein ACYCSW_05890 [bacterium]